jgi:hypothetical protein
LFIGYTSGNPQLRFLPSRADLMAPEGENRALGVAAVNEFIVTLLARG